MKNMKGMKKETNASQGKNLFTMKGVKNILGHR